MKSIRKAVNAVLATLGLVQSQAEYNRAIVAMKAWEIAEEITTPIQWQALRLQRAKAEARLEQGTEPDEDFAAVSSIVYDLAVDLVRTKGTFN
jgi:hypothetical protein